MGTEIDVRYRECIIDGHDYRIRSVLEHPMSQHLFSAHGSQSDGSRCGSRKNIPQALVISIIPFKLIGGVALSSSSKDDRLTWTSITLEDRKKAGYIGRDDADLTNRLIIY